MCPVLGEKSVQANENYMFKTITKNYYKNKTKNRFKTIIVDRVFRLALVCSSCYHLYLQNQLSCVDLTRG